MLPSDNHVHTRWSWDTAGTSTMEATCRRAVELGLPAVAFAHDWLQPAERYADLSRSISH